MMNPVLETKSTYKGYPYVVLFMPGAYRCGYVGVPYSHKLAKKSFDELSHLRCHGGVTYAESHLYNCDDKYTWWIGFDCAHCFDGYDIEIANRYFGDDPDFKRIFHTMEDFLIESNKDQETKIRSLAYVKDECKKLIDQIEKE
jgi:hypothetical protein